MQCLLRWSFSPFCKCFPCHRAASTTVLRQAFKDCEQIVEKYDKQNYEWVKTLPAETRAPIVALRAFNAETSLIGDVVTQGGAPLRTMRFAWWREAINSAFAGKAPEHPVTTALQHCIRLRSLSKYRFQRMLTARESDQVEHRVPSSMQDLESFAENTSSQLHYLQLEAVDVHDSQADHVATHLGKAVGIANILRGTPHLLTRGISYLPLDLCAAYGVSSEALFRGEDSQGLRDVVFQVATAAQQHLHDARNLHGSSNEVPSQARNVFLSSISCGLFLDALEKYDFNLLDPRLEHGGYTPIWYFMQLCSARLRNRY